MAVCTVAEAPGFPLESHKPISSFPLSFAPCAAVFPTQYSSLPCKSMGDHSCEGNQKEGEKQREKVVLVLSPVQPNLNSCFWFPRTCLWDCGLGNLIGSCFQGPHSLWAASLHICVLGNIALMDSCIEPGVGLDGLLDLFQLHYSIILQMMDT